MGMFNKYICEKAFNIEAEKNLYWFYADFFDRLWKLNSFW